MVPTLSEIYPNPPIEFVACEVQYPVAPGLGTDDSLPALHRVLSDWLPLVEPEIQTTFVVGSAGQQPIITRQYRFISRDRRTSVVVSSNRTSVETTDYPGWVEFRRLSSRSLEAIVGVSPSIAGLSRVGLRYIDEIRVPDPDPGENRWARYIDPRLSGHTGILLEGRPPTSTQGALQFDLDDGFRAVVRYGAREGQTVGNVPLRRRGADTPENEHFLFDIDSFWESRDTLPEYSVETAITIADRLHQPVRTLFESSITEDLRNHVLRRAPSDG